MAPTKRRSTGGGEKTPKKLALTDGNEDPIHLECRKIVSLMRQQEKQEQHESIPAYLESFCEKGDNLEKFLRWTDDTFPRQAGVFLSDPNLGCEKMLISKPVGAMCRNTPNMTAYDVNIWAGSLIPPMSLLHVKGWTRSVQQEQDAENEKLSAEMKRLGIKQMEAKVSRDVQAMTSWAEQYQADANRQGNLDVKYLHERYDRGVQALAAFTQEKHRYITLEDNHDQCAADILRSMHTLAASSTDGTPIFGLKMVLMVLDATCWPNSSFVSGAMEALKAVCNSSDHAAALVLGPILHSNVHLRATVDKRRELEDKMLGHVEVFEGSLSFLDAPHGNDRRRRSQQFSEWGNACWRKQLSKLNNPGDGKPDFHFLGFILQEDDKSDPGLASVPNTWIPDVVVAEFTGDGALATLQQKMVSWNSQWEHLLNGSSGRRSSTDSTATEPRTSCQPTFAQEQSPIDLAKVFEFPDDCVVPKESLQELLGTCVCACNSSVECYATKDGKLYLVNTTNSELTFPAGELFGFGKARVPQNEFLPWLILSDSDLVVHQTGDQRKVMALAQVYCQLACKHGVMNISLVDYSVQQKVDGNGDAMNFRYDITAKNKVNVFLPKVISNPGVVNIKASSFGALFNNRYGELPNTVHAKILWEVVCEQQVPAVVMPRKAKFWWLSQTTLRPQMAHLVKA
eukprot:Skav211134  [mRNA]  locus=scaffold1385:14456:20829:+ [translate_table: standard]